MNVLYSLNLWSLVFVAKAERTGPDKHIFARPWYKFPDQKYFRPIFGSTLAAPTANRLNQISATITISCLFDASLSSFARFLRKISQILNKTF
jgi:hypothetical protein